MIGVRDLADIDHTFGDGTGILLGHLPLQFIHSCDWLARIDSVPARVILESEGTLIFPAASAPRSQLFLTRESTSPSPFSSDWAFPASMIYTTLLSAYGVAEEALRGASLEDLPVLARLFTSLLEGKILPDPTQ